MQTLKWDAMVSLVSKALQYIGAIKGALELKKYNDRAVVTVPISQFDNLLLSC